MEVKSTRGSQTKVDQEGELKASVGRVDSWGKTLALIVSLRDGGRKERSKRKGGKD